MPRDFFHNLAGPLDHSTAAALVTPFLPLDVRGDLVPLGEGDFCVAFRGSGRLIRVAKHAEAAAALRRESCVLARIADHLPLTVPRPDYHEPGCCPPFSVHEEVGGEILTRDGWLARPASERQRIAADLGAFLGALHGLPADPGRLCGLRVLDFQEVARTLAGPARRLHPRLVGRLPHLLHAVLDHCRAGTFDGSESSAALIHGDIAPGHLLLDPTTGRLTGVIDFGDLALGDPARDFIYIYEDFGAELLDAVSRHYPRRPARVQLSRIRLWYLLETVQWTLRMLDEGREVEVREGIAEIGRELAMPGLMPE